MTTHRCDNCQKIIEDEVTDLVIIGRNIFNKKVELCLGCAAPIVAGVKESKIAPKLKEKIKM